MEERINDIDKRLKRIEVLHIVGGIALVLGLSAYAYYRITKKS